MEFSFWCDLFKVSCFLSKTCSMKPNTFKRWRFVYYIPCTRLQNFVNVSPLTMSTSFIPSFIKIHQTVLENIWKMKIVKRTDDGHCYNRSLELLKKKNQFYDRLRLIRSVWRASKFSVLKLNGIVTLWVYYTIAFDFSLFRHFWASLFNFLDNFLWLRITDDGSVPEMRIWSILLIKSA